MNTNSLSFQLGTSVAQYLMQYGEKELNYEEFKAGIKVCDIKIPYAVNFKISVD